MGGRLSRFSSAFAEVPVYEGITREEALQNIREAITLSLESLEEHGDPVPPPITEEIVEA